MAKGKRSCRLADIIDDEFIVECSCTLYFGGRNLKLHRERLGISQEQLAARLTKATGIEVTQMCISRWERAHVVGVDEAGYRAIKKVLEI